MKKIIAAGFFSLVFAGVSLGDWYVFVRSSGDWSNLNAWISASSDGGPPETLPDTDDQPFVDGPRVVSLDVDATIDVLYSHTRTSPPGNGAIIADQGKAMTVLRGFNLGTDDEVVGGTYILTDGALSVGGTSRINKTGTLDIGGGTVDLSTVFLTGTIKVAGDDASIQMGSLTCNASSLIAFTLGESGVSLIDCAGATVNLANSAITVDGSDFSPGTQVENITLIRAANLASVSTSVSVNNLPTGTEATVVQDQDTDTVYLRVVPPPTVDFILYSK